MYWDESEIFKILPFFNSSIEILNSSINQKIKKFSNIRLLKKLPFLMI